MWCNCPFCHIAYSHPSKWPDCHCNWLNKIVTKNFLHFFWSMLAILNRTYPPPIVIIELSAAINSSEPWPKFLSPSMPTHGYFARSGYNENRNVSPVPKYACRCPLSSFKLRANQRVEQYAPNTWKIPKAILIFWHIFSRPDSTHFIVTGFDH